MPTQPLLLDEELIRRLPMPLAQLYHSAHSAKTSLERYLTAYFFWEVALKLLSAVAVVEYAQLGRQDPQLADRLKNLARPALGHWWEILRLLTPVLADAGDEGFRAVRDLLLGKARHDLPRAAGLDVALHQALEGGPGGARGTVRLSELFDRLVRFRNKEMGHGAPGRHKGDFYERLGQALLAGVGELLGHLDVLAGRRLWYVANVSRLPSGQWQIERYELKGETGRLLEPLAWAGAEVTRLPCPGRLYLAPPEPGGALKALRPLHPLVVFDAETEEVLFLNARRGKQRTEYLCYSSGRVLDREELAAQHQEVLARLLDMPVDGRLAAQWAAQAEQEATPPGEEEAAPPAVADLAQGQVGDFEILSTLGKGGTAVVYRARQSSLGRQVALKCLLRSGDARAEARFAREIRALGRVRHPHLVEIYTSGAAGTQWFYAMELVEGATLACVCDRLQTHTRTVAEVNLATWQESLDAACGEARQPGANTEERGATTEDRGSRIEDRASLDPRSSILDLHRCLPRPGAAT
jgi:hypothetical protein